MDARANLYISADNRVRRVDAETGIVSTIAGKGKPAYSGDSGPAISAQLKSPLGVGVDGAGNVYVVDSGNGRVRRIDAATGLIATVAGGGTPKIVGVVIDPGDGAAAVEAFLKEPTALTVEPDGTSYFQADRKSPQGRWFHGHSQCRSGDGIQRDGRRRRRGRRCPIRYSDGCRCGQRWKRVLRRHE